MNIDNILICLILFMVFVLLFGFKYETFVDTPSNTNVYFQDNNNQKYILVSFDNLKPDYKQILKNMLLSNGDFMKHENLNGVMNDNKFTKTPLVLIKENDISKMTDNLSLTFDVVPTGSNFIFTPVINNNKVVDHYIYNDYDLLYYAYDGNNILETNKNIYITKLNEDMYSINNTDNNNPLKIVI